MTDEALARALAAAFCGRPLHDPYVGDEYETYEDRWLRVAAMARVVIAMEKP